MGLLGVAGGLTNSRRLDLPLIIPRNNGMSGGSAGASFYGADPDVINAEQARSDIRSTTRAGYANFDSQPGLQALLDSVGVHKAIYLPANGVFNLAGKNLTTKSVGQSIISFGSGAGLQNGGVNLYHRQTRLQNLYLYGAGAYGVNVDHNPGINANGVGMWDTQPTSGPQQPSRFSSTHPNDVYFTHIALDNVWISGKTTGLTIPRHLGWTWFRGVQIAECTTGAYVDMNSTIWDCGDVVFNGCGFVHCTTGMRVVKCGGLRLTDCKFQVNTDIALLLEPLSTIPSNYWASVNGVYIGNCSFEDSTNWDIKISAQAGVPAALYPNGIQIAGGKVDKLWFAKGDGLSLIGPRTTNVTTPMRIVQDSTAVNMVVVGVPRSKIQRGGAGTSFIDLGMDSTAGAYIHVGGRLTLFDSLNPNGKLL